MVSDIDICKYYRLNKGCRRDKFVTCRDKWHAASILTNFTNLFWARSTSETDLITNITNLVACVTHIVFYEKLKKFRNVGRHLTDILEFYQSGNQDNFLLQ